LRVRAELKRPVIVAAPSPARFEIDKFCDAFGATHFVFDRSRTVPAAVPERRRAFENSRFLVTTCGPGD
jgi:hypothetical protein